MLTHTVEWLVTEAVRSQEKTVQRLTVQQLMQRVMLQRILLQQGWLTNWFTKEEAAAHGLTGPFDYVLEAGEGYFFADAVKPEFFTKSFAKDGGDYIGKHGHFPARGDKPPFVLSRPGMACKTTQDHSILDIAPTICKSFGLNPDPMEGESLL